MFDSRGHAVEHVLVISLQVPELVYLVVTHQLRHAVQEQVMDYLSVVAYE